MFMHEPRPGFRNPRAGAAEAGGHGRLEKR
jgi:hypothetical protein